jgi:23S rRNA (cytosine1962-C5)-methyltransferase
VQVLFEDDHLLAVNKPSGLNSHRPHRFAPDGLHEWLCKRHARWAALSILQRLDKGTSGVMIFGKSAVANRAITAQFQSRRIAKSYLLLTSVRPDRLPRRVQSDDAVTEFDLAGQQGAHWLVSARPLSGRTHQVRRHAAQAGFPILGDHTYGGAPAPRLMLHARAIRFAHPLTGRPTSIEAPLPRAFAAHDPLVAAIEFRELVIEPDTTAYRLINGDEDGLADTIVDRYADRLLVQWQSETARAGRADRLYAALRERCRPHAIFEQTTLKSRRSPPRLAWTDQPAAAADTTVVVTENGCRFGLNFVEGFSPGIFPDQRENRRRLLRMDLTGRSALNCFAYTCAFSVAAARAGATVTSADLSRRHLDRGRENFRLNGLAPDAHEFVYGDVFDWLKRFARGGRAWDVVLLDPPTFSTGKGGRVFRAERDYLGLQTMAMTVVAPGGWLFVSTNARGIDAARFEHTLRAAARACRRVIEELDYETLPFDFRVPTGQKAYLKTLWARLA